MENAKPRPGATYTVAGFCARYPNEPAENCCPQLTEQTRSREYKSSDQRDHERKQHKVTQEHEHTYALFFISQSCPQRICRRLDSRLWNRKTRSGILALISTLSGERAETPPKPKQAKST